MAFDSSKNFMIMEDNNDGTLTLTINLPKMGIPEQIITVIQMELSLLLNAVMAEVDTDSEDYKNFDRRSTIIPNIVEE